VAPDWSSVYAELSRRGDALTPAEFDQLAVAAYLLGRDDDTVRAFERAHAGHAAANDVGAAARSAYWLGVTLFLRGEMAPGGGWMARAARLAEEADDRECQALLLVPDFLGALDGGDAPRADELTREMLALAAGSRDHDVLAMVHLSRGQALLLAGACGDAMKLFDEVMVAVMAGEVSPIPAGLAYCIVVDACMQGCDVRRASEWTDALNRWCDAQPDLVPYRGQCLVHRSQVLQYRGAWDDAITEAAHAERHLTDPPHPALGMALYQQGELRRLRGEFAEAERFYRLASAHGRDPRPGLALLRLAEGNADAAVATIQRMLPESESQFDRPAVLLAAVEVLAATGDLAAARAAADELAAVAASGDAVMLRAMSDYAAGCVAADPRAGLAALRRALTAFRELGIAYEEARVRVKIADACAALGDADTQGFELDAARDVFARLGAAPDLAALGADAPSDDLPITGREVEVLQLVAKGMTNREIAGALVLSEHTVARHLQNIFLKLGVSSRAAATAYAY
jgi:ATP/maltotriose-dependent transcriptional regulator MalT